VVVLRGAVSEDRDSIYEVWYRNEVSGVSSPPPPGSQVAVDHELSTGEVMVACVDDRLVAFAAVLDRPPVTYLAEVFVDPAHQSQGIGGALPEEDQRGRWVWVPRTSHPGGPAAEIEHPGPTPSASHPTRAVRY
jgi:GNAT superfamily N-acetyltransferase